MSKFYKIITPEEDRYINQFLDNISFQKKKKIKKAFERFSSFLIEDRNENLIDVPYVQGYMVSLGLPISYINFKEIKNK